jgi:cytochrome c-type biogenesis protein
VDSSIFFGGSVIAAVVAGVLALFAPCCISVMLPAYFATTFQNRRVLVAMTFLFAAGVATVILPLALGANVLRQLVTAQHAVIYVTAGLLMLGLGLYVLLGGQIHLPMPGRGASNKTGPISVYSLGVFSGIASSCCAPVLAGVIALSGVASSFGMALGLGAAYVFGMVAPLFVIAVLWERVDWRASTLFRPRAFTVSIGSMRRTITATNLASGLLLTVMGVAAIWIGVRGKAMGPVNGWQADLAVRLQHYGRLLTEALSWVPGWAAAAVLVITIALLGRHALRQMGRTEDPDDGPTDDSNYPEIREDIREHQHA